MPNGNNLQDIFSDKGFLSLSPDGRRAALRQIVPLLRQATDDTVDKFASAIGGPSYQQATNPQMKPGNIQAAPNTAVMNPANAPNAGSTDSASMGPFNQATDAATFAGVLRDLSQNYRAQSSEQKGFWKGSPSIPGQAMQEAQTMTPQKMGQGAIAAGKTAAVGAAAGGAALGGAALLGPTAVSETVGTGLLDAGGQEITRDIVTQGPSVARQILTGGAKSLLKWAAANPAEAQLLKTALKTAIGGASIGGGAVAAQKFLKILGTE